MTSSEKATDGDKQWLARQKKYIEEYREEHQRIRAEIEKKIEQQKAELEKSEQAALQNAGLNFDTCTDEELRRANTEDILEALKEHGMARAFGNNGGGFSSLYTQSIQIRQNWVVIRQNEQIIRQNQQIIDLLARSHFAAQ